MSDEIEITISQEIAKYFRLEPSAITRQTRFVEDLNADSLARVQLVMDVEERFDILIPDKVAAEAKTVGDLVALVERTVATTK